jgi:putative protein-disulfide isomerase
MKTNNNNPLLCNPTTGVCEMPINTSFYSQPKLNSKDTNEQRTKIIYFTDPICSSCWGIEPQLRKLKLEYGNAIEIEYRMGGLLPNWSYNSGGISKPSDVATHWDDVSKYYEMPIDGDVWLEDPLDSSYPPSIAFKAAQLQSADKAIVFLRALRELVFLNKKNITKWEHIAHAATIAGLNVAQLKTDYENVATSAFNTDLKLAQKLNVRGFPTLFFVDANNNYETVYGFKPYEAFENALLKANPNLSKQTIDAEDDNLFTKFPSLTTKEYSVLSNTTTVKAEQILNALEAQKKITKQLTKNGAMWRVATN